MNTMGDGSDMVVKVKDGRVERFEKHMPKKHWLRNKKQSVDYARESPFAAERQLEDQRFLMQHNRNPALLRPTKLDKHKQLAGGGHSTTQPRAIAVKAHVLNKVVREASGMHAYTIIPPPKAVTGEDKVEKLEPETNARVRPYLKEAKMKPVLCSFGHRPRSASRTFHPATMRFRLRHSQIVKADDPNRTGVGLPVTVLSKVLRAPMLSHVQDMMEDSESLDAPNVGAHAVAGEDVNNLFFSAEEQEEMFGGGGGGGGGGQRRKRFADDATGSSWASSQQGRNKNTVRRKQLQEKLSPVRALAAVSNQHDFKPFVFPFFIFPFRF